ncbi:MAG: DNA topoisomerase IV subunit B [Pseudomonadota bacterium]
MNDLFSVKVEGTKKQEKNTYTAQDIEVLEGLEPVRRRPGMYIGGTDENALHHLVSEVLDNSMDEAVAGHATRIAITMHEDGSITVEDNGRGIPIDPHPKFPDISALEVILTTLHSGGKFSSNAYQTAGGLHGVGVSVVNALSEKFVVEVVRDKNLYRQKYSRGAPLTALELVGPIANKRGTSITFHHDPEIFGPSLKLEPSRIYQLAKSKAYLYRGIEIKWTCDPSILPENIPANDILRFPNGLTDYLVSKLSAEDAITTSVFSAEINVVSEGAKVEWAIGWHEGEGFSQSYCNTISTPLGGTHEQGMRSALLRGLKAYGEMTGNKRASNIIIDDILENACVVLSIFIRDPLFQGQTKEKLVSNGAVKLVENAIKDRFDHWLSADKAKASKLLDYIIERAEERISRKSAKAVNRKSFTQKLRLPGKLTDCSRDIQQGTELFIVEGDSAGGSAKQARNRETQAILPLRGKILNVANSSAEKISQNQEITDLGIALACGTLGAYRQENLRYEKIIIMTDADVDGAHIAALLMTFFYMRMPKLISDGHLYIAQPPLYRLTQSTKTYYAANDIQKEELMAKLSKSSKAKIELGRFKGLGEMTAAQLKETTMNPKNRILTKVTIGDFDEVSKIVDDLMGKKPEKRFQFIYDQALIKMESIVEKLDV